MSLASFFKLGILRRVFAALLFLSIIIAYCFMSELIFSISNISIYVIFLAIPALLLVWAAPDIKFDWDRLVYPLVLVFITSQIVIPNFYAVPLTGVGWANLRKVVNLALTAAVILSYGLSRENRLVLKNRVAKHPWIIGAAFVYLISIVASIPLSSDIGASIVELPQALTAWVVAFFAILSLEYSERKQLFIAKWIVINALPLAAICFVERILGRRIMFDIMPASMISNLLQNPSFALIYKSSGFRSGSFRAVGSFSGPLATGEFGAMAIPLAFYFLFFGKRWDRAIGVLGGLAAMIILITANARGGLLATSIVIIVSAPALLYEMQKRYPVSLVPSLSISITAAFLPLFMFTDKFRYAVFGGGATTASNDGRIEQFYLALPHIIASPIWGNGFSTADAVIGFNPGGGLTIDSGILAAVVDQGLPGVASLTLMLIGPVCQISRSLLTRGFKENERLPFFLSLSLLAYFVNTIVLAQTENFALAFLEIALYCVIMERQTAGSRSYSNTEGMITRSLANL